MKLSVPLAAVLVVASLVLVAPSAHAASLVPRVNEAYRAVHGQNPTPAQNAHWVARVRRGDKKTFNSLVGAIAWQKANAGGKSVSSGAATHAGKVNGTATTNKTQLIKDVLPLFVQIYGKDPANADKVWWRKRISCNELKSETALVNSMKYHKGKNVTKGRNTICGQKAATTAGLAQRSVAGFSDHPLGDTVRIGLQNAGSAPVKVTANGPFQVRAGSDVRAKLDAGNTVTVTYSGNAYHVRGSGVEVDDDQPIRLVPVGGTIMQVTSYNDKSTSIAGKNYNRFRGTIEVRKCSGCSDVWIINEARAEHYAKGLAETLAKDPAAFEYYKALATAARSYALYHRNVTGGRQQARGYDVGRTADDQIYRGYEFEILVPRLSKAVDATRGIIVTDKSGDTALITTYFSDTDGRTRSAKEAWNTSRFPHLQQSVPDPHHVSSTCRGHCVGMSAQGAFGFAKADGWSFKRILAYYYKNTRVVKAY